MFRSVPCRHRGRLRDVLALSTTGSGLNVTACRPEQRDHLPQRRGVEHSLRHQRRLKIPGVSHNVNIPVYGVDPDGNQITGSANFANGPISVLFSDQFGQFTGFPSTPPSFASPGSSGNPIPLTFTGINDCSAAFYGSTSGVHDSVVGRDRHRRRAQRHHDPGHSEHVGICESALRAPHGVLASVERRDAILALPRHVGGRRKLDRARELPEQHDPSGIKITPSGTARRITTRSAPERYRLRPAAPNSAARRRAIPRRWPAPRRPTGSTATIRVRASPRPGKIRAATVTTSRSPASPRELRRLQSLVRASGGRDVCLRRHRRRFDVAQRSDRGDRRFANYDQHDLRAAGQFRLQHR